MNQLNQWAPVAVIVGGYLLGIYFQQRALDFVNKRIDSLEASLNKRIDGLEKQFSDFRADLRDLRNRFDRWEETIVKTQADHETRLYKLENPRQ